MFFSFQLWPADCGFGYWPFFTMQKYNHFLRKNPFPSPIFPMFLLCVVIQTFKPNRSLGRLLQFISFCQVCLCHIGNYFGIMYAFLSRRSPLRLCPRCSQSARTKYQSAKNPHDRFGVKIIKFHSCQKVKTDSPLLRSCFVDASLMLRRCPVGWDGSRAGQQGNGF